MEAFQWGGAEIIVIYSRGTQIRVSGFGNRGEEADAAAASEAARRVCQVGEPVREVQWRLEC